MWPKAAVAVGSAAQLFGRWSAAAVDERDDEDAVAAQLMDHAPGVHGHFADIGVIEFRHPPADARGLGQGRGSREDLAHDGLGVRGRVLGDVVVDRLEIGAGASNLRRPPRCLLARQRKRPLSLAQLSALSHQKS